MLVTVKPHSTLAKYFNEKELKVDLNSYYDLLYYLNAMQPAFLHYIREQRLNQVEESITFLDKNLHEIIPDEMFIRKAKADDIIYIVPAIVGGGGKRGGLLAILAVAMFAFVALPALGGAGLFAGAGASAGAVGGGAAATVGAAAGGGHFLSNLVINLGLSLIASLFNSKKDATESTRQNDMFGSLANSTASGTAIALHFGMVRAAGQLLSGYIKTINSGAGDADSITVRGVMT